MVEKLICQVVRKGILNNTAHFQVEELDRDSERGRYFVQFEIKMETQDESMVALTTVGDILEFEISDYTFSKTKPLTAVSMRNTSLVND